MFHVREMLNIGQDDIDIALADLTSVISFGVKKISFLHASLPDFLLDQARSGEKYYIDTGFWGEEFVVTLLRKQ